MVFVIIQEKGGEREEVKVTKDHFTIGRVPSNDLPLPKNNVSKRHAEITWSSGVWELVDLNSTNGTFVNGEQVAKHTLSAEDKVIIGDFLLQFTDLSSHVPEQHTDQPFPFLKDEHQKDSLDSMAPFPQRQDPLAVNPLASYPSDAVGMFVPPNSKNHVVEENVSFRETARAPYMENSLGASNSSSHLPSGGIPNIQGDNLARQKDPRITSVGKGKMSQSLSDAGKSLPKNQDAFSSYPLSETGESMPLTDLGTHDDLLDQKQIESPLLETGPLLEKDMGLTSIGGFSSPVVSEERNDAIQPMKSIAKEIVSPDAQESLKIRDVMLTNSSEHLTVSDEKKERSQGPPTSHEIDSSASNAQSSWRKNDVDNEVEQSDPMSLTSEYLRSEQLDYAKTMCFVRKALCDARKEFVDPRFDQWTDDLRKDLRKEMKDIIQKGQKSGVLRKELPEIEGDLSIADSVLRELSGFGALEEIFTQEGVREIYAYGFDQLYMTTDEGTKRSECFFSCDEALVFVLERLTKQSSYISENNVCSFFRLKEGGILQVFSSTASSRRLFFVIRKLGQKGSLEELKKEGCLDEAILSYLKECIRLHRNVLITGPVGTEPEEFLLSLVQTIPEQERCVFVGYGERDLFLDRPHWIRLCGDMFSGQDESLEDDIEDVLFSALALQPQRFILENIQGPELPILLPSMAEGYSGVLFACEAVSLEEMFTFLAEEGVNSPQEPLLSYFSHDAKQEEMLAKALDVVVVLGMCAGERKVNFIEEISWIDNALRMKKIVHFERKYDESGKLQGKFSHRSVD